MLITTKGCSNWVFYFSLREGCKIENRLNLGHCPNLPDLPPSPKTWDANLIFFKVIFQ